MSSNSSTPCRRETYVSPPLSLDEAAKIYSILHNIAEATRRRSGQSGSSLSVPAAGVPGEEASTAEVESPAPSEPSPTVTDSPARPTVRLVESDASSPSAEALPSDVVAPAATTPTENPAVTALDFASASPTSPTPPPTWPASLHAPAPPAPEIPLTDISYPAGEAQPVGPETSRKSGTFPCRVPCPPVSEPAVRRSEPFPRVSETFSRGSGTRPTSSLSNGGSMLRVTVSPMSVVVGPSCAFAGPVAAVVSNGDSGFGEGVSEVNGNGWGVGGDGIGGAGREEGVREVRRKSWPKALFERFITRRKKVDKGKGVERWTRGIEEERARDAEAERMRVRALEAEMERGRRMEKGRVVVVRQ
ncbi:hypothetical protein MMC30_000707 [Trapelia coarctata]|nr:hypothetical protein [Trapelia coarctata]